LAKLSSSAFGRHKNLSSLVLKSRDASRVSLDDLRSDIAVIDEAMAPLEAEKKKLELQKESFDQQINTLERDLGEFQARRSNLSTQLHKAVEYGGVAVEYDNWAFYIVLPGNKIIRHWNMDDNTPIIEDY